MNSSQFLGRGLPPWVPVEWGQLGGGMPGSQPGTVDTPYGLADLLSGQGGLRQMSGIGAGGDVSGGVGTGGGGGASGDLGGGGGGWLDGFWNAVKQGWKDGRTQSYGEQVGSPLNPATGLSGVNTAQYDDEGKLTSGGIFGRQPSAGGFEYAGRDPETGGVKWPSDTLSIDPNALRNKALLQLGLALLGR